MKSLKICLALFFALFLLASCIVYDRNNAVTDGNRSESKKTESDVDTDITDKATDRAGESDTVGDTDTGLSEQTKRMHIQT